MSYIKDTMLSPDEEVLFQVHKSWMHYLTRLFGFYILIVLSWVFLIANPLDIIPQQLLLPSNVGIIVLLIVYTISYYFILKSQEYVVTSSRVLTKEGIFSNDLYEIQKENIESIDIDQSLLGRIFSYGTLEINGTGNEDRRIVNIDKPIEFRKAIQ